ncbi:unnamed protein product [Taenia asiatica]|uniref:Octapeptide-repeat protein T2 n=1 Tax=Taenia asiatica TaxID=60517 RepID=A0A0R3WEE8_TAEAS|nr:unnamed protein product [Taenia asiatica]
MNVKGRKREEGENEVGMWIRNKEDLEGKQPLEEESGRKERKGEREDERVKKRQNGERREELGGYTYGERQRWRWQGSSIVDCCGLLLAAVAGGATSQPNTKTEKGVEGNEEGEVEVIITTYLLLLLLCKQVHQELQQRLKYF